MPILKKSVSDHRGIQTYSGSEAGNFSMGQAGFDILVGAAGGAGAAGKLYIAGPGINTAAGFGIPPIRYFTKVKFWVALRAINGGDSSIICKTMQGDDFMTNPLITFDEVALSISNYNLDLQKDDTLTGAFTKIRICDAATYIQAFRG